MTVRLGVDIGGTRIKAAPVDLERGALVGDRQSIDTPHPATPAAVAVIVAELVDSADIDGLVGPAVQRPAERLDEGAHP
jgi:polyphosphate glucokinase